MVGKVGYYFIPILVILAIGVGAFASNTYMEASTHSDGSPEQGGGAGLERPSPLCRSPPAFPYALASAAVGLNLLQAPFPPAAPAQKHALCAPLLFAPTAGGDRLLGLPQVS